MSPEPHREHDEQSQPASDASAPFDFGPTRSTYVAQQEQESERSLRRMFWYAPLGLVAFFALLIGIGLWQWYQKQKPQPIKRTLLVRGVAKPLSGAYHVTFWSSGGSLGGVYAKLNAAQKERLLAEPAIAAPAGFKVEPSELRVASEPVEMSYSTGNTIRRETTVKHDEYVIHGTWNVTVPDTCAAGEYDVRILFPGVYKMFEELDINTERSPDDAEIVLRVKVGPR